MTLTFADELAAFRARTADPGYAALILLGTRQATTAALLIGTLRVQQVAFLLTDETRDMPNQVAALLGCTADGWLRPPGDHSTTLRVYEGLRQVMEIWADLDHARIAVDVTGGLKPMSLGLEKAAHVLGLQTIYIQSDYGSDASGKFGIVPGSQRLEVPPDPYAVFGDLEAAEAHRLYDAHNYAGAHKIFAALAARVPGADGARYTALATLAAMYTAWDVLDFAAALGHADLLVALPLAAIADLAGQAARLAQQRQALHALVAASNTVIGRGAATLPILADAEAVLPLIGTLHAAALRRAAQGRYDFAALFRYRCLELISQHRLATYGLSTNRTDYRALPMPKAQLSAAFQDCQRAVGRTQPKGLPDSITLFDGYMLLAALDDPLVREYAITRIEERSKARNQSVLAHGYRLIGPAEYAAFAEVVDEIVDRLFAQVLGRPRADWEATLRFVEL